MRESEQTIEQARTVRNLVQEHGSPLLILDCDRLRRQYRALIDALPGVAMYYAIKALLAYIGWFQSASL